MNGRDQLSKHFKRGEFACNCGCGFMTVDQEMLPILEDVREVFGAKPIKVNSGCRCNYWNKWVGGADKSRHLWAMATDFWIPGVKPSKIAAYLREKYPDRYGIGEYDSFVHVDLRPKPTRWYG